MACFQLDNQTARRVFLDRHALIDAPTGPAGPAEMQKMIERLGFIQVDSVQTVARAHHMILWSRKQNYRPRTLDRLLEKDRSLFENWTHDAAIIPTRFFPYWQANFDRRRLRMDEHWPKWRGNPFMAECDVILKRISDVGPVCASDTGGSNTGKSGGWWDWNPAKTSLEYLWRSGKLAITRREGFRKFYDLTERVIPQVHRGFVTSEASIDWACNAAIERLGFATHGEIAAFWALFSSDEVRNWCQAELAADRLVEGHVTHANGKLARVYARPDITEHARGLPQAQTTRLRILSPFDPALRDRKRAERLFGFHYRIEIFVPEAKRRYGYYVFPVMEGARMLGRIDAKTMRELRSLSVRAFWPEAGIRMNKGRIAKLEAELNRLARFTGCESVDFADHWLRDTLPPYA